MQLINRNIARPINFIESVTENFPLFPVNFYTNSIFPHSETNLNND